MGELHLATILQLQRVKQTYPQPTRISLSPFVLKARYLY